MFSVILKFKDLALFNVIIFLTTELFLQNSELNVEKKMNGDRIDSDCYWEKCLQLVKYCSNIAWLLPSGKLFSFTRKCEWKRLPISFCPISCYSRQ